MSDELTRLRRADKIKKRNLVHKAMRENKGAFAVKVENPKKTTYKRENINPRNYEEYIEDEE